MRRQICVFVVRTWQKQVFSWRGSIVPDTHRQNNSTDCGLFAFAHLAEFCFNNELVPNVIFDTTQMRAHLLHCFKTNGISPFPKTNKMLNTRRIWLCWGLTSQSTIFQSCRDGAIASWVINQYFRGVKCLAQGHNTAEVGLEPRTIQEGKERPNNTLLIYIVYETSHEKTCLCHMRTTKAQISLSIRAVWSAPLFFAA